jgi:hypothetical protein
VARYHRVADHERARNARYREAHREELRLAQAARYAEFHDELNARRREKAAARAAQRRVERPNCMICGKRLTDKQRARGVTCSPSHASTRYRWFVKAA